MRGRSFSFIGCSDAEKAKKKPCEVVCMVSVLLALQDTVPTSKMWSSTGACDRGRDLVYGKLQGKLGPTRKCESRVQ
jgi:hypothetical protein